MTDSEIRQRIIRAAGPIFARKGFQAATVREICRKAGVNVAAVNYYFGSKENLYRETVASAHPVKFTQSPFYPSWTPDTAPAEKLRSFVATMVERVLQLDPHSWQEELLLREVLNPTPVCQSMIRHHFRAGMEVLRSICQELLPPQIPEDLLLRTMLSIVAQCVYYRTARKVLIVVLGAEKFRELCSVDKLVDHITRFSLAALGAGPPIGSWAELSQEAQTPPEATAALKNPRKFDEQPSSTANEMSAINEVSDASLAPCALESVETPARLDSKQRKEFLATVAEKHSSRLTSSSKRS